MDTSNELQSKWIQYSQRPLRLKGSALVLEFAQEVVRVCSSNVMVVGWYRRITQSMLRLVGTKIEIFGISIVLPILRRLGDEL